MSGAGRTRAPVVAVIGGGITGLSAAYSVRKQREDARVLLFESRTRLGGNVRTEREQGCVFDAGPDSFLRTKPWALELCKELGLESEFRAPCPAARTVYFAQRGRLERMPEGMILGVPTRVRPLLDASFLSLPGKLRLLSELLLPRGFGRSEETPAEDETISAFIARRFGEEAARCLSAPLLAGIYAGSANDLSILSTFPNLPELERRYGSVIRGMLQSQLASSERRDSATLTARVREALTWLKKPASEATESPFVSLRNGMGTLVDALAKHLVPTDVRLGAELLSIRRRADGTGWSVQTTTERVEVDAVVLATPAHAAARLVPDFDLAQELAGIRYTSTATVFFAVPQRGLRRRLDGAGFVVPPGGGGVLAATWVSSKWAERAPADTAVVRAFLGGVSSDLDIARESDQSLAEIAQFELARLMGPLGEPRLSRVYRHVAANPQPSVGHSARLARIRRAQEKLPQFQLVGAAYDGVSLSDCVRQGRAAAAAICAEL